MFLLKLSEGGQEGGGHFVGAVGVGHDAARHQLSFRRTAQWSAAGHGVARQNENYFRTFPKLARIHTL